jgi:ADP-L-glycero-D-manno-heptose 6-epimerase
MSMATRNSSSTRWCGAVCASADSQIAGFRYFNVYGPREQHKGRMASVAFHHFNQYRADGKVRLFEGYGGYGNGEQRRDFVYVGDVVKVNMDFLESGRLRHLQPRHRTRAELQRTRRRDRECLPCAGRQAGADGGRTGGAGHHRIHPFPEALKGKYQSFTEADLAELRAAGYRENFATVEEGVADYVKWLAR